MNEIVPGIATWSIHDEPRDIDFNGWHVLLGDEAVLVDPPAPSAAVLQAIRARRAPRMVLLTNKHHTRASEAFRAEFHCPILVHQSDAPLMEIRFDGTYRDGDVMPCGLRAVTVPDSKTPGETAFLFDCEVSSLIVGDAVIGKPKGSLSMLAPEKFKDMTRAILGLRRLLDLDFEALLLGDGVPIVRGGRAALARFLA